MLSDVLSPSAFLNFYSRQLKHLLGGWGGGGSYLACRGCSQELEAEATCPPVATIHGQEIHHGSIKASAGKTGCTVRGENSADDSAVCGKSELAIWMATRLVIACSCSNIDRPPQWARQNKPEETWTGGLLPSI